MRLFNLMIVLAIPKADPKTQHIDPQTHEGVSSFCVGHCGSISTKHHVHESHMFFLVADLTLLRTKGKGARTHTPRLKIGICFHLWFDKDITIKVTWVLQIWTARWIARPCHPSQELLTAIPWIRCWFGLRSHGQIWISVYAPCVSIAHHVGILKYTCRPWKSNSSKI